MLFALDSGSSGAGAFFCHELRSHELMPVTRLRLWFTRTSLPSAKQHPKSWRYCYFQILSVLFRWWRTPLLWQYDWMPPVWQLLQDVARVLWVVSLENKSYNHTEQGVWKDPFQLRPFGGPNIVFSWKRLWICCESQILNIVNVNPL